MNRFVIVIMACLVVPFAKAQVGIGTNTPNGSAMLEMQSNSRGLLIPRMSRSDRDNISQPPTGLLIFQNTETTGFYSNTGTPAAPSWSKLDGGAALPAGAIVMSETYPDASLQAAGFGVYKAMYMDSTADVGPYGNWSSMDTTGNPNYNSIDRVQSIVAGGRLFTEGSSSAQEVIGVFNPTSNTWTTLSLPAGLLTSRDKPFFAWTGTELLIYGGNGSTGGYRYNPTTSVWTTMSISNEPVARNFPLHSLTGTDLIVWGGNDASLGTPLTTGAKYNLASNTWTPMGTTNAPAYVSGMSIIAGSTSVYVYGGSNSLTKISKYDIAANTWTVLTPGGTSVPTRSGATMAWYNGFIYMFGGQSTVGFPPTFFGDGYIYNVATNGWSINVGRPTGNYVQVGNKLYTFAGLATGFGSTPANTIRVLDLSAANPTYSLLGTAPLTTRANAFIDALSGNRLMLWGGVNLNGNTIIPMRDGRIFNITGNTFSLLSSDNIPPGVQSGIGRTVSGKFVLWNLADASARILKGYLYTPDVMGIGNPQQLRLYLYKKN